MHTKNTAVLKKINTNKEYYFLKTIILLIGFCYFCTAIAASDPLPSWNKSKAKDSIISFVNTVTNSNSADYVKPADRIAVFDNDGTLWTEKPFYNQFAFAMDRFKQLAVQHPDIQKNPHIKALLKNDKRAIEAMGEKGLLQILALTHTGMTAQEFNTIVQDWISTAKHPRFKRLYTQLTYQPQLELLAYLKDNGFKNFIVSGGGIDFIRPWSEAAYNIPPQRVIGSSVVTEFAIEDGQAIIKRLPKINFIDDKAGKPVGIQRHIGRRPILAFGNSDGDLEMLQYTTMTNGKSLGLILHHTDPQREYSYDRNSKVGQLNKALDLANSKDWIVVDMMKDWKRIFSKQ